MNNSISPMRSIILAAGLGTRLRPITEHIPKPLIPVAGMPLLEHILLRLRRCGIQDFAVNTHHLSKQIRRFLESLNRDFRIRLFHEPKILGTGGALFNAKEFLSQSEAFVLHNGDTLSNADIDKLIEFRQKNKALGVLLATDYGPENKLLIDKGGQLLGIGGVLGKKPPKQSRLLAYTGIAVFAGDFLNYIATTTPSSLIDALLSAIKKNPGSILVLTQPNLYWNDLGTLTTYLKAHEDILLRQSPALDHLNNTLQGPVFRAGDAHVAGGAQLTGFIALGRNCVIEENTELHNCVIFNNARVPAGTKLSQAVIGENFTVSVAALNLSEIDLVKERGFTAALQADPLVEQGSDRTFFRLREHKHCEVLSLSPPTDPDFERYIEIGAYLHKYHLGAPAILAASPNEHALCLEDLGDDTLYLLAREENNQEILQSLYEKVLDFLIQLQTKTKDTLSECAAVRERIFGREQFLWETAYFRNEFLHRDMGLDRRETAPLAAEFERLAQAAAKQPLVFMHRDFQSQNILIKKNKVRIVDFQGARIGPLAYDLASLLKDAYIKIHKPLRDQLLKYYWIKLRKMGGPDIDPETLGHMFLLSGLQRNMQALGAFSYLSLVKGKKQFRRFIPRTLEHLVEGLEILNETKPAAPGGRGTWGAGPESETPAPGAPEALIRGAAPAAPGPLPRLQQIAGRIRQEIASKLEALLIK